MIVLPVEKKIDWNRPPLILIGLVICNILMFAFYQSGDQRVFDRAVRIYTEERVDQLEYPAFEAYQQQLDANERVAKNDPYLAYYMLLDQDFREFIDHNQDKYISARARKRWRASVTQVNEILDKASSKELGLNTDKLSLITLLSHQFLHGDFWHLFGNMVFLLLTGFAVEAALGHGRFLLYYLLSGVGAGLLFTGMHNLGGATAITLVGASGSISGVMAMYLALFRFRKIEFFYWLFVFTGYFRAAAIVVLPAYIFKELYFLIFTDGSNIAYTAHIGGFLAGAALVIATQVLAKHKIDDHYIEGKEEATDPYLIELNGLYQTIADCDFRKSWTQLSAIKKNHPGKPELDDIQLNLLTALDKDRAKEFLFKKLVQDKTTLHQARSLMHLWNTLQDTDKSKLSFEQLNGFARHALIAEKPQISEQIFARLRKNNSAAQELAILARKIGFYYDAVGQDEPAHRYKSAAQDIMQTAQV